MVRSAAGEHAPRRILVVEDDHDIRTSLEGVLLEEGFEVSACGNGQEALSKLATTGLPDLIILDLMMPIMDGWQFRITQKNDPALAQIPVIAISADVSSKAAAVDAAAYLSKPFEHGSLMRTIDRVLLAFERRKLTERVLSSGRPAPDGQSGDVQSTASAVAPDPDARLKSAFIDNVSHEVRTPLNVVLSLAQLLRDGTAGPLTVEQRRYLDIIQRSGEQALSVLSDIIDLAAIESGKLDVRCQEIGLADVARTVLPPLSAMASAKSLALHVQIPEALPAVRADAHRAGQVLRHLVHNAIKFTEDGTVKVLAELRRDCVAVHVSDTGLGIPEEAMARIFVGFSQIDSRDARRHQGAGIGLSLSHGLVRLMGGEITLASTVGAGSRFTFTLPRALRPLRD